MVAFYRFGGGWGGAQGEPRALTVLYCSLVSLTLASFVTAVTMGTATRRFLMRNGKVTTTEALHLTIHARSRTWPAPELMHILGREKLKSESLFKGIAVHQADKQD